MRVTESFLLARENPIMIDGPAGALQALHLPVADARGIALICHPNPSQGGTMLNKVVSTLQRTARDSGLATLRFTFVAPVKVQVSTICTAVKWMMPKRR